MCFTIMLFPPRYLATLMNTVTVITQNYPEKNE
jgi:hypothetical protein